MFVNNSNTYGFSVKAWQGDAKTLLAFNFDESSAAANIEDLAGFSIQVKPHGQQAYYLFNMLSLPAGKHAVVASEPANSSANAPIQKFRWLHVPGSFHQGDNPFYGVYTYTIIPRYFKNQNLLEIDTTYSVSVDIQVQPFATSQVELGFTRGFTQSQAFTHHFGNNALFQPAGKDVVFDTKGIAGTDPKGQSFTFEQEYEWSGFTAREKIFDILNDVESDDSLSIDIFAYDLNEPDIVSIILKLASEGRIRIILDNASLHHKPGAPEDWVEQQFNKVAIDPAQIMRGKFGRFAHDKVIIVSKNNKPVKVLSGSTNFSITGIYVNSNHVIVFNNSDVAELYSKVFNEAWNDTVSIKFHNSSLAEAPFEFNQKGLPTMKIAFSPHPATVASSILQDMATRVTASKSSVLFAVMDISSGGGPVFPALQQLHANQQIYSYGISDSPGVGISLYKPGSPNGVLVGGRPGATSLPPPFDKEHAITGLKHQIHHKFIVCDFNTPDCVLWCGSSNLAEGGEEMNGDNLIEIHDTDIATVFAIEALALVDHFDFRETHASGKATPAVAPKAPISKSSHAASKSPKPITGNTGQTMHLYSNNSWAQRYFDKNDLYFKDRELFA